MTLLQSILLGVLQGLTEFLPVSSSGHLVLAKSLMNIHTGNDISFEVFVHFGTFISVVVVFIDPIRRTFAAVVAALKEPRKIGVMYRASEDFRLAVFVVIGCIPAGIFGVMFNDRLEQMFDDPKLVADMLLITGAILFFTRLAKPSPDSPVTLAKSIGIGFAQAVAVIPGISRSGSTIGSALMLGVSQDRAAEFSFLMALPVILGATILKATHLISNPPPGHQWLILGAGTMAACLTGYVALRLLLSVLRRGRFSLFSYYCFIVGILGILFVE